MKTKEEARAHLEQAIPNIGSRYIEGVSRADWATAAASDQAERNYADGVARAVAARRRQVGVKKVSNSEWQDRAVNKGGAVIGERVRMALDKYQANFGAVYDRVVEDIRRLPPRTTDFRSNITSRVVGTVESWKKHSGKL